LSERLAGRWSGATFASVFPSTDHFRVQGSVTSHVHQILVEDLGLTLAPILTEKDQRLSLEAILEVDADALLLGLFPREDSLERDMETAAPYLDSPLWQRLPAVEKGQVYEYDAELTYTSPLTAEAFHDVVERFGGDRMRARRSRIWARPQTTSQKRWPAGSRRSPSFSSPPPRRTRTPA
jgi:ABC-type Fe3+-hydroxamate transport system substrate-binding protein